MVLNLVTHSTSILILNCFPNYPMVIIQCLEGLLGGTNRVFIVLFNTDAGVYNVQRNMTPLFAPLMILILILYITD